MDTRRGKEDYYLDIADAVLNRSTCLRRKYGAIIVRNDEILSTGYNGAPRGRRNCTDVGGCMRETLGIPSGARYISSGATPRPTSCWRTPCPAPCASAS